jgi:hypothetical protein
MRDPIATLGITAEPIPPFVRLTGELMTNGTPCPELDALCRHHDPTGNGSSSRGFDALCSFREEQVRPLIEQAKRDKADRVNMEHNSNLMHTPGYAQALKKSVQDHINAAEGARTAITAQEGEVRDAGAGEQGEPSANPTTQRIDLRQNHLRPLRSKKQDITVAAVSDPAQLATLLQTGRKDAVRLYTAVKHLTAGLAKNTDATAALLSQVPQANQVSRHHDGQIQALLEQAERNRETMAGLDTDMRVFRDTTRFLSDGGTAAPAPMEMDQGQGSGSANIPPGRTARFNGDEPPALAIRPNYTWYKQNGTWQLLHEPTAFAQNGSVRPYEARLAEWEAIDNGTPVTTLNTAGKVRMPPPPHFTGEGPDVDPDLFLMSIETYFSSINLPRADWGKQAQALLRGKALAAYGAIALPLYSTAGRHPTWEQVREIVLSYRKCHAPSVARTKLASIKQNTDSVADFNLRFKQLLAQVGNDPPAPTDLMAYYLRGLNNPTKLHPIGSAWESLEQVQEFHLRAELEGLKVHGVTQYRLPFRRASGGAFSPTNSLKRARLHSISTQRERSEQSGKEERSSHGAGRGRGGYGGSSGAGRGSGGDTRHGGYGSGPGGGRGGHGGGRGAHNGGQVNTSHDHHFGSNLVQLLERDDGPCPHPLHKGHAKRDCGIYKRLRVTFTANHQ